MHWYESSSAFVRSQDDLGWLIARGGENLPYFTGSDVAGWEDSTWVLNSFYELPFTGALPTHDELHKSRIASGDEEPLIINGVNLDDETTSTGGGLGYQRRPKADWQRRTWSEMLSRFPRPSPESGTPPCYHWFPIRDFPANIELPTEGSLAEEDFTELIDVLARHSSSQVCSVYFAEISDVWLGWRDTPVFDTRLADLPVVIKEAAEDKQVFTPANIWPPNKSWLVYTDYDLWATKVSGSTELINELRSNPVLETLDWVPAKAADQA
jgi:hypothetical protein